MMMGTRGHQCFSLCFFKKEFIRKGKTKKNKNITEEISKSLNKQTQNRDKEHMVETRALQKESNPNCI